ncbi:hypothetical protein jhhlp_008298 [Lomentospora prolificans]|uniref:DUF1993 domain-containing protein n=1 Tax=Lomentospora prolificans TaxID=41688 RepID=A0A2N3MXN2_9PEZI|nr:hypothetical protein jhhlp_008298 [Lomentospora prolificans]
MPYSLADATLPVLKAALATLSNIIKKLEAHATANSIPLTDLPNWKLADDMLPLSFQVFMVCDAASKFVSRASGEEPASFNRDTLTSLEACHTLIADAQKIVDKAEAATIEKNTDVDVTINLGPEKTATMPSRGYAEGYTLPNVFFHLNMAYAIGRSKGVQLGKMDYLTPFIGKWIGMA